MDNTNLALRFAVAIGLGILLGLERERTKGGDGGARSQPDPTLFLAAALGVTLPFNILAGIPLYYWLATQFVGAPV